MQKEPYESLRGDGNPMRRPEVAAKQSASLTKTWRDPARRKKLSQQTTERWATPGEREKQSERMKAVAVKWTPERKAEQAAKMRAYWAKVRAALEVVGESQHG